MKKRINLVSCLLVVLFLVNPANAVLQDNQDGTVTQMRSDGSQLMWLQDANLAATSGYCLTSGNCLDSYGMVKNMVGDAGIEPAASSV